MKKNGLLLNGFLIAVLATQPLLAQHSFSGLPTVASSSVNGTPLEASDLVRPSGERIKAQYLKYVSLKKGEQNVAYARWTASIATGLAAAAGIGYWYYLRNNPTSGPVATPLVPVSGSASAVQPAVAALSVAIPAALPQPNAAAQAQPDVVVPAPVVAPQPAPAVQAAAAAVQAIVTEQVQPLTEDQESRRRSDRQDEQVANLWWKVGLFNAAVAPIVVTVVTDVQGTAMNILRLWWGAKKQDHEITLKNCLITVFGQLHCWFELYGKSGKFIYKTLFIKSYNNFVHSLEAVIGFKNAELGYVTGPAELACRNQLGQYNDLLVAFDGLYPYVMHDLMNIKATPIFSKDASDQLETISVLLREALREERV